MTSTENKVQPRLKARYRAEIKDAHVKTHLCLWQRCVFTCAARTVLAVIVSRRQSVGLQLRHDAGGNNDRAHRVGNPLRTKFQV